MKKLGPVALALGGLLASTSYAQTPAGAPPGTSAAEDAASNSTTEIIVTAQRRSEKLQDTPLAITAVTAATTQRLGLTKAVDIAAITPGASFSVYSGFFTANIRGLGVPFVTVGLEAPVAVYEDGAYLPRTLVANEILDNFDISSIQVLRGPQGTLYGRNATGGVIIVNSANPTDKLEGRIRGEFGNLEHRQINGMINMPLAQDLALRVTGGFKHNDGYIHNLTTGKDNGWERNYNVRAKLRWHPGNADIVLGGQYYDIRNTLPETQSLSPDHSTCYACILVPGIVRPSVGFYDQEIQIYHPPTHTKAYGADLKMNFDFDTFELSSTTTFRHQKTVNGSVDNDWTPLPLFDYVGADNGGTTYTQDLQVTSKLDGPFDYLFGLSYLNDKSHSRNAFIGLAFGGDLNPDTAPGFENISTTRSYAAYLEGYYKITDALKVTLGGRYTYEKRANVGTVNDGFAPFVPPFGPTGFTFRLSTAQRAFTPRFVLAWDNGPTNLYYSFTRGFKAGGYPGSLTGPVDPVKPEKISSHEVGIKQSMLDNRLRLNVAAFYYKNRDQQSQTIDVRTGGTITSNAGAVENYGVEAEAQIVPLDGLNIGISGGWQHARYKPFRNAAGLSCFDPTGMSNPFAPGATLYACPPLDLTGTTPPMAPEWSGSFSAGYEFAIASWTASLSALGQYRSSVNFYPGAGGPLRHDRDNGRFLANASGYVSPPGKSLRIGFYVNNLFDKKYVTSRQTLQPFGTNYNAGMPRTYGLRAEYTF
ncbi:TonB-dependent receptor [Rhizorhabdus argentea]|uniref:TonB-dependent receptor n=1 Tax=Rhizorhabdus argentea TaxID=1387174 RepID=UPI0030EEC1C2